MQKILTVAVREFSAMVATKAFLLSLVMMPLLMGGGLILMPLLTKFGGGKDRTILVADGTGQLLATLQNKANARTDYLKAVSTNAEGSDSKSAEKESPFEQSDRFLIEPTDSATLTDEDRLALSDKIRNGELYAFVEIPAAIIDPAPDQALPTIEFVSSDAAISSARQWMSSILQAELRDIRFKKLGIDGELVAQADLPTVVEPMSLYSAESDGTLKNSQGANTLLTLFLPFGIMMLMFMIIFLAAQPMLESGMEEKSQRIAELLLGSITPNQLMSGKLLGNVAGSLLIFMIYGVGGWFVLNSNGWADSLPWSLMPYFIVFQVLGVLFYSSIFLTVGASISDLKEAQSVLLPVWMFIMLPMMVWFVVIRDPNGVVPFGLSFFPPTASMMMILRLATGQAIPAWQAPLAAVVLLVSTLGVIYVAGKLYRISLLRTDAVKSILQLFARLRQPGN
jgi:ABC-2 type transport system permease protein